MMKKRFDGLNYIVEFDTGRFTVGCQTLKPETAMEIALEIIEYYS